MRKEGVEKKKTLGGGRVNGEREREKKKVLEGGGEIGLRRRTNKFQRKTFEKKNWKLEDVAEKMVNLLFFFFLKQMNTQL